jgi:hypothetical protein
MESWVSDVHAGHAALGARPKRACVAWANGALSTRSWKMVDASALVSPAVVSGVPPESRRCVAWGAAE